MTSAHSHGRFSQSAASLLLTAGLLVCVATPGSAQYTVTNLVSNPTAIGANPADPHLVNNRGLTPLSATPFCVSEHGTAKFTLYYTVGHKPPLAVAVPPPG